MKRGKKMSDNEVMATRDFIKSTYLLNPVMKKHLIVAAIVTDTEQTEIVREAIKEWFEKRGVDISKPPALPNYSKSE